MGFRFRKSIKVGPARINLSKSGVGYSVGTKGLRFTKKADGGTRTTASIPGTGISYVKDSSNANSASNTSGIQSNPADPGCSLPSGDNGSSGFMPTLTEVLLCVFLGWAGIHKFYQKKKKMGLVYLFTFGLFCIGWWSDVIRMIMAYVGKKNIGDLPTTHKILSYVAAVLAVLVIGGCSSGSETDVAPTVPSEPAIVSTEPSTEPATEATTEATTEPATEETTEPTTEATTEETTEPTTEATTEETTEPTTEETEDPDVMTYVLNTNTKKFHYPSCSSAKDIKEKNKKVVETTREDVISMKYEPCGRCHP